MLDISTQKKRKEKKGKEMRRNIPHIIPLPKRGNEEELFLRRSEKNSQVKKKMRFALTPNATCISEKVSHTLEKASRISATPAQKVASPCIASPVCPYRQVARQAIWQIAFFFLPLQPKISANKGVTIKSLTNT